MTVGLLEPACTWVAAAEVPAQTALDERILGKRDCREQRYIYREKYVERLPELKGDNGKKQEIKERW